MGKKKSYLILFGLLMPVLALFGWGLNARFHGSETVHYKFEMGKRSEHNLIVSIPFQDYREYRAIPRPSWDDYRDRPNNRSYYDFFAEYKLLASHPDDDYLIQAVADKLEETASTDGLDQKEKAALALYFIQSFTVTSDNATTPFNEYPRYPLETLFEQAGDCEDTSILLAALLTEMDYDVALLLFEDYDHIGLGVNMPPEYEMRGNSWIHDDGRRYWYLDSLGKRSIGWCPEPYDQTSAYVYPMGQ
jgi:hypothetical protein